MKKGNKRKKILSRLIAVIMCLFCAFSFSGCFGGGASGSNGNGGGSSSGGNNGGQSQNKKPQVAGKDYYSDLQDVLYGAIGVYDIDKGTPAFYDKYSYAKGSKQLTNTSLDNKGNKIDITQQHYDEAIVSFNYLVNRQFEVLANYIYISLEYWYGDSIPLTLLPTFGTFQAKDSVINPDYKKNKTDFAQYDLNFNNSINGGYTLEKNVVKIDDKEIVENFYYGSSSVAGNVWKSRFAFNKDNIKMALLDIYLNQVKASNGMYTLNNSDKFSDDALKSYYSNKSISDFIGNYANNKNEIKSLDFDSNFYYNVLYFVAYSIIGSGNIAKSQIDTSILFREHSGLSDNEETENLRLALQNYKGYEVIVPEVISQAFNLYVTYGSDSVSYFQGTHYLTFMDNGGYSEIVDHTPFAKLYRKQYIFYRYIEDIYDSLDYYYDEEEAEKNDNYKDDEYVHTGKPRKLERVIFLPKIDVEKFEKDKFSIKYLLVGFQTVNKEIEVSATFGAKYDNAQTKSETPVLFNYEYESARPDEELTKEEKKYKEECEKRLNREDNRIIIDDDKFMYSYDLLDANFYTDEQMAKANKSDPDPILENYYFKSLTGDYHDDGGYTDLGKINEAFPNTGKVSETIVYKNYANKSNVDDYTKIYTHRYISSFNNFIKEDGDINITKNYFYIDFDYYDKNGNLLEETPEIYINYFYVSD